MLKALNVNPCLIHITGVHVPYLDIYRQIITQILIFKSICLHLYV